MISYRCLNKNFHELAGKYALPKPQAGNGPVWPIPENKFNPRWWLNLISYNWGFQDNGGETCMNDLWQAYLRRQSWGYRLPRLSVFLILYLAMCFVIISYDWPRFPVRGTWSRGFNFFTLGLCVPSFLILTLFVFDATKLCSRFVSLTLKCQPHFSPETMKRGGGHAKLPPRVEEGMGFWPLGQADRQPYGGGG